jgi:hypothetical protein
MPAFHSTLNLSSWNFLAATDYCIKVPIQWQRYVPDFQLDHLPLHSELYIFTRAGHSSISKCQVVSVSWHLYKLGAFEWNQKWPTLSGFNASSQKALNCSRNTCGPIFLFSGATAQRGPGPRHSWSF